MKRSLGFVAVGLSVLALAACTSLPTSGNYQSGLRTDTVVPDARWQFNPNGPADGASPAEIVLGFLDAGESPSGDWQIAREFLTADAAASWDPYARVVIDDVDERDVSDLVSSKNDADAGQVTMRVSALASLDDTGVYSVEQLTVRSLDFGLVKVAGQWRISAAPDGIVVQSGNFANIFLPQTLMFSGHDNHLVADMRWFPDVVLPVRRTVEELVDGGPAPWLEGAVSTAFEGISVVDVQIDGTLVTVSLSSGALDASAAQRARMQTQLELSLAPIGIESVRMTSGGSRVTGPADQVADTEPDARAIVMTADDFGYLAGGEIERIPGLSEAIRERFTPAAQSDEPDPATSIAVSPDLTSAVAQTKDGSLWRIDAKTTTFEPLSFERSWVAPSLDPFGFAWSARDDDQELLWVWGADNEPVAVTAPAGLTQITSLAVSRDGARIALLGFADDQPTLLIAAVRRDEDGAPIGVDGVQSITHLEATGTDLAWVSPTLVAASMSGEGRTLVREQQVGGTSERLTASFDSTALVYGNTRQRERLLAADGSLFIRYQRTWQQAGSDIVVLATQVGAPERDTDAQQ